MNDTSPRALARLTGALFLLTIVTGIVAQMFISDRLVVPGNAVTTAGNIVTQEGLFRLGFTIYLVEMASQIGMTVFLKVNDQAAAMALAFFGFSGVVRGYLVFQSTFLPRFLGVLTLVGGLGWLTFLSPSLGMRFFPIVAGVGILGALLTIGWLLIKGVNEPRWKEQASLAAASIWR